ncbi:MAG: IS110 family transposase [Candidatus Paracaedibacteraceae bacterium]|nr:IS110 family transposase [Candidatus Paracaedibacteraceae bacterium]
MMTTILGIDVSKSYLDCFDSISMRSKRFPNTLKGIEDLIKFYKALDLQQAIIEATSIYHRSVHRQLEAANFIVRLVNPYKARCFAKSAGFLAKTDKVDAKMLCQYGEKVECQATSYPSRQQEELESLLHYKKALEDELIRQINQQEYAHCSSVVQGILEQRIGQLKQDIKSLNNYIEQLIETHEVFRQKKECLQTVPGIAAKTIASLLCYLPELGSLNRKQIASLAGLAPYTCESGQLRGKSIIKGGRPNVRKALYMPILVCISINPLISPFYKRLRSQGKVAKVALTACMRKLLTILNSMLKNLQPWDPKSIDI